MYYCSYCGNQVADEARYCPKCGKEIYRSELTVSNTDDTSFRQTATTSEGKRKRLSIVYVILGCVVIIVVIGALVFWNGSERNNPPINTKQSTEALSKEVKQVEAFIQCLFDKNVSGAKELIESGLNPNAKDSSGKTLLQLACAGDNYQIVKFLIDKGANVNVKDKKGGTPLMLSSSAGYTETVRALLSAKDIDINAVDSTGLTALQWAEKTKAAWEKQGLNTAGQEAVIRLLQNLVKSYPDENTEKNISLNDLQPSSMAALALTEQCTINEAVNYLGKCLSVKYEWNDAWAGAHAWFDYGEIWIERAKDTNTRGRIARLVITRPGFATQRGVGIGDNEQKVLSLYGQPDYISSTQQKRYAYFLRKNGKKELMRLVFHFDTNNQVDYVAYSQTAGGI